MTDEHVVEMDLLGVTVELPSSMPVVMLRERGGARRHLQIFIGHPEASAIAFALEGAQTPRPMTHDLMQLLLDELGVELTSVVITEVRETTFYGELHLVANGDDHVISCRPSDALALAARFRCPIRASEEVMEEAGFEDETEDVDDADPEEVVEEFRHFIDSVNPDDFAS